MFENFVRQYLRQFENVFLGKFSVVCNSFDAIQIAKIPEYFAQKHYYGSRSLGYEMNNIDSVDIDSALDLMVAAEIIKRGLNTL